MKSDEPQSGTSFGTNALSNMGSWNSVSNAKFGGLIEESWSKTLRRELSVLFAYIFSVASQFSEIHGVVFFLRILQFVGPSICASFPNLWVAGSLDKSTASTLSVLFHFIHPDNKASSSTAYLIGYSVIVLSFLLFINYSARFFKKNAMLPSSYSTIIVLYLATFGQLLHPVALDLIFGNIAQIAFSSDISQYYLMIAVSLIALTASVIYIYLVLSIINQSLQFLPSSMMSISSYPENLMFVSTFVVNAIIGFASQTPYKYQYYVLVGATITYFVSIFIPFIYGGFVKRSTCVAVISSSIVGVANSIMVSVFLYLNQKSKLDLLFGAVVFFIFVQIMASLYLRSLLTKRLDILDQLIENNQLFGELISSPNEYINIVVTGASIAHPLCVDWTIYKQGVDTWQKNQHVWFVFAKFVSIYPEETQKLIWIFQTVISMKVHGVAARTIKNEAMSIVRQRESNLSAGLKEKLNSISHRIQGARLKLRHVWDVVIQGNTREVEASCLRSNESIERVDADIKHLLQQFPNNKFVTRVYSRFLLELKADQMLSQDMAEKTKILQRGVFISADRTHELGLAAFQLLPERVQDGKSAKNSFAGEVAPLSLPDIDADEETTSLLTEQSSLLRQSIDELDIPAISQTKCIRCFLLFFVFCGASIGFLLYISQLLEQFREPLPFLYNVANLRTYAFQMATFSMRFVYQQLGFFSVSNRVNGEPPVSLGSTWDLKEQLDFIVGAATSGIQTTNDFRSYEGDAAIEAAKAIVYGKNVNYIYYTTPESPSSSIIDLQQAMINIVVQLSDLLAGNTTFEKSIINTSALLNPLRNVGTITNFMNSALTVIIDSIHESSKGISDICFYIDYVAIVVIILISSISIIVQVKSIQQNKAEVSRCLTALPKNIVSQIVENMRVIKHDESGSSSVRDSEMNRQEENILKVFSTGNAGSATITDIYGLIIGTFIFTVIFLATALILNNLTKEENSLLENSAPHLDYITGSYALTLGSLLTINALAVQRTEVKLVVFTETALLTIYEYRMNLSEYYYHMARYGGEKVEEVPFAAFAQGLAEASARVGCPDRMLYPTTLYEISDCFSPDLMMTQIKPGFTARLSPFLDFNLSMLPTDRMFTAMFDLLVHPIYDAFLFPMFEKIIPTITSQMNELYNSNIGYIYALIALALLVELFVYLQIKVVDTHIRIVLRLLLHCPPHIVLQTPKIMSILSGDFSEQKLDTANRDAEFFDDIYYGLPDAVLSCKNDDIIESANKACCTIFKIPENEIRGKKLSEILIERKVKGSIPELMQKAQNSADVVIIMAGPDGGDLYLSLNTYVHDQIRIVSLRDITQTVRYNALIKEERSKSDSMLAAILPPSLVKRVQNNEKNISFAVQSASIVFIDIVSFTPWCSSNPASIVMQTLNLLFKKFDALLTRYPTMTKIKCIGDCYMAAGGVFSEINQPSVHAKEVVSFGLDALDAIEELNSETGQSLQIRVGINTGGPIVGGVLGIGKPTFEILGPAINMAQQMEHHGIAMKVHISRPVYELIYGDTFSIKERGEVEIKGGNVITYIVSRVK